MNVDINNPKEDKQVNINDAGWIEKETVVYEQAEEAKPQGPVWGDALQVTRRAEIPEDEDYFPSLGGETTE